MFHHVPSVVFFPKQRLPSPNLCAWGTKRLPRGEAGTPCTRLGRPGTGSKPWSSTKVDEATGEIYGEIWGKSLWDDEDNRIYGKSSDFDGKPQCIYIYIYTYMYTYTYIYIYLPFLLSLQMGGNHMQPPYCIGVYYWLWEIDWTIYEEIYNLWKKKQTWMRMG